MLYHTEQIKINLVPRNTTKEGHPLSVNLLHNMCLRTPQNKGSNYVLPALRITSEENSMSDNTTKERQILFMSPSYVRSWNYVEMRKKELSLDSIISYTINFQCNFSD
jgi:hypothetical protein